MKLFAGITKIDREQRMVFGYASTEALDSQGEVVRKEAIEAALPDYMRFANIREMHQPSAVGIAKEAEIDDRGLYLAARIVDDDAWSKVTEGVYKGFSIGGKVTARDIAAKNVITGVDLLEISLVDRPANPEAVIELFKASAPILSQAAKAGARHSKADLERVQNLHDTSVALGAYCGGAAKHEPAGDLAKLFAERDAAVQTLAKGIADLTRRLEIVEAQPMPAKGMIKAVAIGKEQDGGGGLSTAEGESLAGFIARLSGLPAEKRAHELTKLALRFPQPLPR